MTVDPCDFDPPYNSYAVDPSSAAPTAKLSFIGSTGVGGGQGNADCIYTTCDDHSTYGVAGSQWQGPGNGEEPGDLWNPAVSQTNSGVAPSQQLSAPVLPCAAPAEQAAVAQKAPSRASPAHVMVMGPALVLGAWSATSEAVASGFSTSWKDSFCENSKEACNAVSPVGGYLLKTHVLG